MATVRSFALPANQEPAEAIVPRVCAFDDPTAWLTANASEQRRLATSANVRDDSTSTNFGFGIAIVVPLVHAEMFGSAHTTTAAERNSV
jgi:hypothetical protein